MSSYKIFAATQEWYALETKLLFNRSKRGKSERKIRRWYTFKNAHAYFIFLKICLHTGTGK